MRQEILDGDQTNHIEDAQDTDHTGILEEVNALGENHWQDECAGRDDDGKRAVHVDGALVAVCCFVHKQKDWRGKNEGISL